MRVASYIGLILAVAGCEDRGAAEVTAPDSGTGRPTGVVGAQLTLPGGEHVSSVSYTLTNRTTSYAGSVGASPAATFSFLVGSVAAGSGYTLALGAQSDDGNVQCVGTTGSFGVTSNSTTVVNVLTSCTSGGEAGAVLAEAVVTNCPIWTKVVADRATASVSGPGNTVQLTATALAPDPSSLAFEWAAASGTISAASQDDAGTDTATFTCPSTPGAVPITLVVTDGPFPAGGGCDPKFNRATFTLNCAAPAPCTVGTGCGDGGQVCNAAGSCVPALFSVVVLNGFPDGSIIDNLGKQLPISIQTYGLSGPQGAPVALPTGTDSRPAISLEGNNISEGDLTTSADGRYLSLLGWNAPPGGSIQNAAPVVARIDSSGTVDTSTVAPLAFHDGTIPTALRSAASLDGSGFWISGVNASQITTDAGDVAAGGIYYVPFGSSATTQLVAFPNGNAIIDPGYGVSSRWLRLFGGQLYAGTDGVPPYMINVGGAAPAPTSGSPSVNTLPGGFQTWSGPAPSPYGFVMFDLSAPSGPDTMYIADDGLNPDVGNGSGTETGGGGLYKWTFDGTNWNQVTTWRITDGTFGADAGSNLSGNAIGFRGLAGFATGSQVTLMATSGNVNGNPDSLVLLMQDSASSTTAPVPTMFAPTSPSQVLRGVAITPQ